MPARLLNFLMFTTKFASKCKKLLFEHIILFVFSIIYISPLFIVKKNGCPENLNNLCEITRIYCDLYLKPCISNSNPDVLIIIPFSLCLYKEKNHSVCEGVKYKDYNLLNQKMKIRENKTVVTCGEREKGGTA